MPLGIFPVLLGLSALVTLASSYYLLINAHAVAALFNRRGSEIAPGPGRSAPRRRIIAACLMFVGGSLLSILAWSASGTEVASEAVESHPAEVVRP